VDAAAGTQAEGESDPGAEPADGECPSPPPDEEVPEGEGRL